MSEEAVGERSGGEEDASGEEGSSSNTRGSEPSSGGASLRSKGSRGRGFKRRPCPGDGGSYVKRRRTSGNLNELPFLHGGSSKDPLNLESVKPVDNTENLKPLEIIIPKNMRDPLNLRNITRNRNKRKRRNSRQYGEGGESPEAKDDEPRRRSNTVGGFDAHRPADDPIVSPVPPSVVRKFSQPVKITPEKKPKEAEGVIAQSSSGAVSTPAVEVQAVVPEISKRDKQIERFRFGNFHRYYGSRLDGDSETDPRLSIMKREWFERGAVLDIGCNAGYVTLSIASKFAPRRVVGVDIDPELVGIARKNIRHYCDRSIKIQGTFPASFSSLYGPISAPKASFSTKFPDNVWFRHENYVLEKDELLEAVKEEFDAILALSITKWIHLNWGDEGLKRFFRRAFLQLRPGGRFILEPQKFETYKKRAKFAEAHKNLKSIKFKPNAFQEFLINEVGFESCEHFNPPRAKTKGFERPIQVYQKRPPKFLKSSKSESVAVEEEQTAKKNGTEPRPSKDLVEGEAQSSTSSLDARTDTSTAEGSRSEEKVDESVPEGTLPEDKPTTDDKASDVKPSEDKDADATPAEDKATDVKSEEDMAPDVEPTESKAANVTPAEDEAKESLGALG